MELPPSVAPASWTCPVCLRAIVGSRQICLHEARLGRGNCVRPVCDFPAQPGANSIVTAAVPTATATAANPNPIAIVTTGIIVRERFCRRPKHKVEEAPLPRLPRPASPRLQIGSRNMVSVQDAWLEYVDNVADQFSPDFWKFFCEIHNQSTTAIDAALRGVKKCFISPEYQRQKMFASSKRQLFKRIGSQVMLPITIKLPIQLPITKITISLCCQLTLLC